MAATSHSGRSGPGGLSPPWRQRTAGGLVSLRSATGQLCRNPQQIERAVDLGQVPPGDVEIARGRVDGAVAEQELDRGQSHPGCQEMGGKTRPEGRDAFAVAAPRGSLRTVVALVGGSDR